MAVMRFLHLQAQHRVRDEQENEVSGNKPEKVI